MFYLSPSATLETTKGRDSVHFIYIQKLIYNPTTIPLKENFTPKSKIHTFSLIYIAFYPSQLFFSDPKRVKTQICLQQERRRLLPNLEISCSLKHFAFRHQNMDHSSDTDSCGCSFFLWKTTQRHAVGLRNAVSLRVPARKKKCRLNRVSVTPTTY